MEFDRAVDVPADAWDCLVGPEDFYLGTRWLEVAERTADAPMRYLLRSDRAGPLGALAMALGTSKSAWVLGRPDTLLTAGAADDRPGARDLVARLDAPPADALLPSLVCGGRHLGRSRVLRRPDAGSDVIAGLIADAERIAADVGARSLAFPFVDERDTALRDILTARGFVAHQSGCYSQLAVPAGGFEAYAAALSRRRRQHVHAERRRLAAAGVAVGIEPLSGSSIPRLAVLETQLMAKYGTPWTADRTESILREMLAVFGSEVQVSLAVADGDVRGFTTLVRHQDQWYARQAGFDYDYQGALPLYFEVAYYHPIEVGARLGVTGIHYGLGSEAAKRSRGCSAAGQYSYLRLLPGGAPVRHLSR